MNNLSAQHRAALQTVLAKMERAQGLLQRPQPSLDILAQVETLQEEAIAALRTVLDIKRWPEPTVEPPDMETLQEWFFDSICEATDACIVEHDGTCEHGHPSWFLRLGLI